MPNSTTTSLLVVFVTTPNLQFAQQLAHTLVEERYAACCNILPNVRSVYRWEGTVEQGEEVLLLIKTTHERYPQLQQRVQELHPYHVPEIIALPVAAGLGGYLEWVVGSVGGNEGKG